MGTLTDAPARRRLPRARKMHRADGAGQRSQTLGQIFNPSTNTISKASIFGAVILAGTGTWLLAALGRSSWATRQHVIRPQPVPFSHRHHVSDCGIDCRYCHASADTAAFAGMPSTATCMGCHRILWADSPMLEPVRASLRSGEPLAWSRVHDLPDFVYFDHSIHVAKGVACRTCHGDVEEMPLTWQEPTLLMEWCLDCHRSPEAYVAGVEGLRRPTNCTACHR